MRISELADVTGVSIATLKYYLREGLLHPGRARGATRADYDDTHVERVRLVRTLIDVGRLSIDRVREVVTALDRPPESRHLLLGTAHDVLRQAGGSPPSETMTARLAALGLPDCVDSPASTQLAQALSAAEEAGWHLDRRHADELVRRDDRGSPTPTSCPSSQPCRPATRCAMPSSATC